MEEEIYGGDCRVLVCHNLDIEAQKNNSLDRRVEVVRNKLEEVNKSKKPDASEVAALISPKKLKSALKVEGEKS